MSIDEKVGAHHVADGKQRHVCRPLAHVFAVIRKCPEGESRPLARLEIETDADGMTGADHLAFDAEIVTQGDIEPVRQHYQPGTDLFPVRQRQMLAFGAGRYGGRLGVQEGDTRRNFRPNGVDHSVIENVELRAALSLDDVAEARDQHFAVERRGARDRIGKAGLAQDRDLRSIELLAAKVIRVARVRVDEDGVAPGAAEHGSRDRAGKPTSDNGDIGLMHEASLPSKVLTKIEKAASCHGFFRNSGQMRRPQFEAFSGLARQRPQPKQASEHVVARATDVRRACDGPAR